MLMVNEASVDHMVSCFLSGASSFDPTREKKTSPAAANGTDPPAP